ncbi:MAG: glucuronate isomerase [Halieaceae bacterium]
MLHPDRLLPTDDHQRSIARALYESVKNLPIISPHGHTDPEWFATDAPFTDPVSLFITPDHYVFRMLYSQGIELDALGIGKPALSDEEARTVWRLFAENYHLFRGTPSRIWLDHVFSEVFDIEQRLSSDTADTYFDTISAALQTDAFKPRALFDRFNIEVLATTESPLDTLPFHDQIAASEWDGRVITTFRPDPVMDPEFEGFVDNVEQLGELTNTDISSYTGYLNALRDRRGYFRARGATATDHGHPSPRTADLSGTESAALYQKVLSGSASSEEADLFRAQMLTEMAAMSVEDGMVMQIHPGSFRNHNQVLFDRYGRDMGADIPMQTSYVEALKPMLDRFGNNSKLSVILFTLDETAYSRELAPLAGHYPSLKLGPAWWFHDSPEGMRRFRNQVTETAGFYNTAGFNDDTRAFLSIPARHDLARRIDCGYLAKLVAEHQIQDEEAFELAYALAYSLAKDAYRL